jgi:serine/threonine protein kinase
MGKLLDHRTDIFSAGLVAHILCSGRHQFNHPSAAFSVIDLIKDASYNCDLLKHNTIKGLSESTCGVIDSMLYKDCEQRCQSVQRVLHELTRDEGKSCSKCGASNRAAALCCDQCGTALKLAVEKLQVDGDNETADELADIGFRLTRDGDWEGAIEKYRKAIQSNG